MEAKTLREKYPEFVFKDFSFRIKDKKTEIEFFYLIKPNLSFRTNISISVLPKKQIKEKVLKNLLLNLGLVEMLNYWKLTCSPKIKIEAGFLEKEQLKFWKKLILKGMGQYFFENQIDFKEKNFLKIETQGKRDKIALGKINRKEKKCLIAIGGGKDTPVVIEILKKKCKKLAGFVLNPNEIHQKILEKAKIKERILVKRSLDEKIFELQKIGFLKGHTPFSAFLAFLSLLLAYLFDYQKIAFGWERSSSFGNLKYKGMVINHQWSKSKEFEKMLKNYSKKYLLENVSIVSPIRNLSEIEIAKIFSQLKDYHFDFVSCNSAFKIKNRTQRWCNKCPKCLFTFLCLFPFLPTEKIVKIFGKNLLEDKKLKPILERLTGEKGFKPFECVGTPKETKLAIELSLKKIKEEGGKLPVLLQKYANRRFS